VATHVFVDTNIYLSFYHFSNDDIDSLGTLRQKVIDSEVILHLPRQVMNEWERNREIKLKTAAEEFNKPAFQTQIPRHMASLAMAQQYSEAVAQAKRAREVLIAEATAAARTYELAVDKALLDLFGSAVLHEEEYSIYTLARERAEKGNPPGKPGSIGDQYNWEMLLDRVPENADLYVITKDGDFASALRGSEASGLIYPNLFLRREWQGEKNADLYIVDSIKTFNTHHDRVIKQAEAALQNAAVPVVQQRLEVAEEGEANERAPLQGLPAAVRELAENAPPVIDEVPENLVQPDAALTPEELEEKRQAVEALAESLSFHATHQAIQRLDRFKDYLNRHDANVLADAAISNSQIGWILSDFDVNEFYLRLLSRHIAELEPETVDILINRLDIDSESGREASDESPA